MNIKQKNTGRPKAYKPKVHRLQILVDLDMKKAVYRKAKQCRVSVAEFCRTCIENNMYR